MTLLSPIVRAEPGALDAHRPPDPFRDDDDDEVRPIGDPEDDEEGGDEDDEDDDDDEGIDVS